MVSKKLPNNTNKKEKIYKIPEHRIKINTVYFVVTGYEAQFKEEEHLLDFQKKRACMELARHILDQVKWEKYQDVTGNTVYRIHYNLILPEE